MWTWSDHWRCHFDCSPDATFEHQPCLCVLSFSLLVCLCLSVCLCVWLSLCLSVCVCRSWQSRPICVCRTMTSRTLTFAVCLAALLVCCSSHLPVARLTGTLCVARRSTIGPSMWSSSRHLSSFPSGSMSKCWLSPASSPWLAGLQSDRSSSELSLTLVSGALALSWMLWSWSLIFSLTVGFWCLTSGQPSSLILMRSVHVLCAKWHTTWSALSDKIINECKLVAT